MNVIFSQTLDTNADGQNGLTCVIRHEAAALPCPLGGISKIRFTFQAGTTEGCTINDAYVEHAAASGDAYDFRSTPVQLLFGGSASVVIPANSSSVSDWAIFRYDKISALLTALYLGGGTGSDMVRYKASVANVTDYTKSANEAATVNKTGYSSNALLRLINKIEVMTDAGAVIVI